MQPEFDNLNSPTILQAVILPDSPIFNPARENLSTDPPLNTQSNEIFSFRGDVPSIRLRQNHTQILNDVPIVPMIEEEKQTEDNNEEDFEEVSYLLLKMVKSNLIFQLFFLMIFANLLWDVNLKILLGLSWINDFFNCFICFQKIFELKKKTPCCLISKLKLKLFDNLMLITYKIFILFFLIYSDFPLVLGILLLLLQIFTQIIYMLFLKIYRKKPILSEIIEFGFKLFVLIQVFMLSLKLQGILNCQYKDVFWCFWVLFSILTGASMGFALIFLGKIYQKCFEKVENFESFLFVF